MNSRLRRLRADQARIEELYSAHPHIELLESEGKPADRYLFEFRVEGLIPKGDGTFDHGRRHRAEVLLLRDYPRRAPFCRMTTPVFHPNIDPQRICIGDFWSAGESLADLVARIGELICFQSYNVKSPLNGRAAAWAEQNLGQLPLQSSDLRVGF